MAPVFPLEAHVLAGGFVIQTKRKNKRKKNGLPVAETKMTLMGLVDRLHKRKVNACLNSNP